jgi:23S rRNA pseudouridine2605 synthase
MIRINKYLARCGVASRRSADDLVSQGRIKVNDQVIDTPGYQVDESKDEVRFDDKIITPADKYTYLVLNKPADYVTSLSDPHHSRTVAELIKGVEARVYPVGRLDLDTDGVLLFSNDGEMAHRLTHPKYGITKIYLACVKGEISSTSLGQFPKGIKLPDGNVGKATVKVQKIKDGHSELLLELTEGRKREVKHLCKAVGHPVEKLTRIEFAGITAEKLKKGQWRYLTVREIKSLRKMVDL